MSSQAAKKQRGFGLTESLVALVVVSVGMIGIAALFTQGLRASRTALYRAQAVTLASDMADRIRLNRRGAAAFDGSTETGRCERDDAACVPAQAAADDVSAWSTQVEQRLPGGIGTVVYAPDVPPTYTIRVTWQDVGLVDYRVAIRVAERR